MLHPWIEKTQNPLGNNLIFPRYDGLSLVNIISSILDNFSLKPSNNTLKPAINNKIHGSDHIILLLIDGLGYLSWDKNCQKLSRKFDVFPLTSVFPSTTPAALTTINSGLIPAQHGLPEWFVYLQEIDKIIESLPFTPVGEKGPDYLEKEGYSPKLLFNQQTIYQRLLNKNIPSFVFIPEDYANSSYNKVALMGSKIYPYRDLTDLVSNLANHLKINRKKSFTYIYWDRIDSISHHFGPNSNEYKKEINNVIDNLILKIVNNKQIPKKTTLLITADHGQINTNPKETIYLDNFRLLNQNFKKRKNDKSILPWGNARDVFLAIEEDKIISTLKYLKEKLKGKANVITIKDAITNNLFGTKKISHRFLDRIGNILILPKNNRTIWYEIIKGKKYNLLGHHGGLSPEEMLIPLGVMKLPF